jgi:hypothetical protein
MYQQHLCEHIGALFAGLTARSTKLGKQFLKIGRLRQNGEKALFTLSGSSAFGTTGRHNYNAT